MAIDVLPTAVGPQITYAVCIGAVKIGGANLIRHLPHY